MHRLEEILFEYNFNPLPDYYRITSLVLLFTVLQLLVLRRMIDMWACNSAIFCEVIENVSVLIYLYTSEDDVITLKLFF